MRRFRWLGAAALSVGLIFAAPATAGYFRDVTRPLHVKDRLDRVKTSHGYYCPNHGGCAAAPYRPHPKPRLKARPREHIVLILRRPAKKVTVELTKPDPADPTGPKTLGRAKAHPAGRHHQRWRFRLPPRTSSATSLDIKVSYAHGSSFYFAGIHVIGTLLP